MHAACDVCTVCCHTDVTGACCSGAFKFRGACNAVLSLSDDEARKGVVTHSSGNHAGALALAASLRGIPAHIVVPNNTPQARTQPWMPCPTFTATQITQGQHLLSCNDQL